MFISHSEPQLSRLPRQLYLKNSSGVSRRYRCVLLPMYLLLPRICTQHLRLVSVSQDGRSLSRTITSKNSPNYPPTRPPVTKVPNVPLQTALLQKQLSFTPSHTKNTFKHTQHGLYADVSTVRSHSSHTGSDHNAASATGSCFCDGPCLDLAWIADTARTHTASFYDRVWAEHKRLGMSASRWQITEPDDCFATTASCGSAAITFEGGHRYTLDIPFWTE